MRIGRGGRFVFVAQWILAIVLPAWLFLGRGLVGAELGWMAVFGATAYGVAMLVILLIPAVVSLFDREVRRAKAERTGYSFAMWIAWICAIASGFVIPDADDSGPIDTAVTNWTGGEISNAIADRAFYVLFVVGNLAVLTAIAVAVAGIVRSRHTPR